MLPRHEVPTHLDVEDRVFFGFMTVRHVLVLAAGSFLAMALALSPPVPLPEALRYLAAAVVGMAALAVAFVEPEGRRMEEWLLAVVRYRAAPRVLVWAPVGEGWEAGSDQGGVLVLGRAPGKATGAVRRDGRRAMEGGL